MRIAQIIDSLEVGGAEKMAINYANALASRIEFSGIVATRAEGDLKNQVSQNVSYLFLARTKTIDLPAIFRLRKYCIENKIQILHAHSTSFFLVSMLKMVLPKIKIIWHDHYGMSDFLYKRKSTLLKITSFLFKGIVSVNNQLKNWAEKELNTNKVIYLCNFTSQTNEIFSETILNGVEGKRILCLANLRDQKNHFLLLDVAQKLKKSNPDWTFHLVGKNFEDDYSKKIVESIIQKDLEKNVFIYGSKNDIVSIINQSEIAILTSKSEGLPVALIEYGLNEKPVVTTNVGEIPLIIKNGTNGFIVGVNEVDLFYDKLLELINSETLRKELGEKLYQTIQKNHSEEGVISQYLNWIKGL